MATVEPKSKLRENAKSKSRRSLLGIRLKSTKPEVSQSYWAQEQSSSSGELAKLKRLNILKQHGDFSLAYSTAVQPCLEFFGDDSGYIAFRKRLGATIVLGNPVAPKEELDSLIGEFIHHHKRATFCQIDRAAAEILANRGFYINELGIDTTLSLANYTFNGKQKEWLRYAANWTRKRGFQIDESGFDEITPEEVEEVSEAWRKTRTIKRKEVRFLNRPIVLKNEPGVRKFFLRSPEQKLLAFIFLDPMYRDGQLVGYVTSFKRRHPEAPLYAEHAIMKQIIETLKQEGVQELKLGLSPMAWIEDLDFKNHRFTSHLLRRGFNSKLLNRRFYNVAGHAEYKRRFRGEEEKVYLATQTRFNLRAMFALVGLCGIA